MADKAVSARMCCDVPSSIQRNSGSERTDSDWTITRINDKSFCDVTSSHGNSRTVTLHKCILLAADNSSVAAFSTESDLTITTVQLTKYDYHIIILGYQAYLIDTN